MQGQTETDRINDFLYAVTPIVARFVKILLQSAGMDVEEEGRGFELAFSIKKDERESKMYLQNLLLEIATVDRDEQPLRFDENMRDFDFFLAKTTRLVQSKLKVLFHFLGEEDVETAIEKISQDARHYERVRIWQFDQKNTGKKAR